MVYITLSPPSTTIVPYAYSLDPDETPIDSASHPDISCLTPNILLAFVDIQAVSNVNVIVYFPIFSSSFNYLMNIHKYAN